MLATTLLVTTLLTVMLAAAFFLVSAEQRTTDNSFGTAKALAIAQAGLQSYFSQVRPLTTQSTYDSLRVAVSGGYADVIGQRIRPAGAAVGSTLSLWLVRSRGFATGGVMAGQTAGSRTIAQFAELSPGGMPYLGAVVAPNGVAMQAGGPNPINGTDQCHSTNLAGVVTPAGGYTNSSTHGNQQNPGGSPAIEYVGTQPGNVVDSTHIDWSALLGGDFFPDYTYPGTALPAAGSNLVGYVPGSGGVTIPAGNWGGTLVVQGNVVMADGASWHGILIAGGMLSAGTPQANYTISGTVITGLNTALGQVVQANQIRRGSGTDIIWNSCDFATAVSGMSSLVPIPSSWADTWSTY